MNDAVSEQEQTSTRQDTRFPPGQSGNPAGRPRRHDPAALMREALFRRLAAPVPDDLRDFYRDRWHAEVVTVADAVCIECTHVSSDGPPELAAFARLLDAIRE